MSGVSRAPAREVYLELARRIQMDGGKVLTQRHDAKPVKFPEAADNDVRRSAEKGAASCGCGDTRMVMIPYRREIETASGLVESEKRYVACVNCDAVHLQPRWITGRFARGE